MVEPYMCDGIIDVRVAPPSHRVLIPVAYSSGGSCILWGITMDDLNQRLYSIEANQRHHRKVNREQYIHASLVAWEEKCVWLGDTSYSCLTSHVSA